MHQFFVVARGVRIGLLVVERLSASPEIDVVDVYIYGVNQGSDKRQICR